MGLIDQTDWEAVRKSKLTKRQLAEEDQRAQLEEQKRSVSASRSPELERRSQTPHPPTPSQSQPPMDYRHQSLEVKDLAPKWSVGESMQETRIGDLDLKIGEPYWFMHQGNSEHIWVIDSIRFVLSTPILCAA
jgi:hypothetical protein